MRRVILGGLCFLFVMMMPVCIMAGDLISQADELYDQGGMDNYLKSGDLFAQALNADPGSYEAAWKASRSYREYANACKENNVEGWKDICKEYGKLGMNFGDKAKELDPGNIEGYFWYGCSVGNYSDGVSILTALKEGLKDKTQSSFEKSYEMDKMYNDGGPIKALGRFWFVLPWPLQKKDTSLTYLREYHQLYPDDAEGQVFLAEVLLKTDGTDEAKTLLEKASVSDEQYFANWAKRLLSDI
ncbi:MAG: tetratricopeptide repeat protein [Deltaproteobacteria bacterium]|nr:tetratricopeptide repeat protein [Deltaproteobacteria bacterium]